MLCGGHVGGAHAKKLEEIKTMSSFTPAYIALHKSEFPVFHSEEAAWSSGQRVGLVLRRFRVRVLLWPLPGFVSQYARVQILGHACK